MKHLPSCILSSSKMFLSIADTAACEIQGLDSASSPSNTCNVSTLLCSKQCKIEEWEHVVRSKKIKQLKRVSQEVPIFNRFSTLIVEDEEFIIPSFGSTIF